MKGGLAERVDRNLAVGDVVMSKVDPQSLSPQVKTSRAGAQVTIVADPRLIGIPLENNGREEES